MKWLLLIIVIFAWDYSHAKTQVQCLSEMAKVIDITEEKLTETMVSCAVKMMEGDRMLVGHSRQWRKIRIKLYPRQYDRMLASDSTEEDDMSVVERAGRQMWYMSCVQFASAKNLFMKKCTASK